MVANIIKRSWDWFVEFNRHPIIKTAWGLGFCIVLLAVASKRLLHQPFSGLALAVPGLILVGFEICHAKPELRKYARPLWWNLGMLVSAGVVIAYYALRN